MKTQSSMYKESATSYCNHWIGMESKIYFSQDKAEDI